MTAVVSAALVGVAAWQAASWQVGLIVCGGFAAVALILHGAGILLIRAVRPLSAAPWFPLRHAVGSLARPGNQTRVILLAVGLGSFFVIGVRALQSNLIDEFSVTLGAAGRTCSWWISSRIKLTASAVSSRPAPERSRD